MDLSVVIVSWNTRALLEACLSSVFAHTRGLVLEVFVVDNASADGSAGMVRAQFPRVRLIRNTHNLGLARAYNEGIRLATGAYVVLLNPDTLLKDNAFGGMLHFMQSNPGVGILGCKILTEDGRTDLRGAKRYPTLRGEISEALRLAGLFPGNILPGRPATSDRDRETSREVEVLGGACLMIRREALEQVGLFDEQFFVYGAEIDWYYRATRLGWKVFYLADAQIVHAGSRSTRQVKVEMGIDRARSRYRLFRKHRGAAYAALYRASVAAISLGKLGVFALRRMASTDCERRQGLAEKVGLHRRMLGWAWGGEK